MVLISVLYRLYILCPRYHLHQVVQLVWISLTLSLSHHSSLSSIAHGRSSRLHPMSIQSCCRFVLLGQPTQTRPCEGVHRRSLMRLSLLLQQCPTYFVCLIWMVLETGSKWLNNCCFVGCCFQDLFNTTCSIFVQFLLNFF